MQNVQKKVDQVPRKSKGIRIGYRTIKPVEFLTHDVPGVGSELLIWAVPRFITALAVMLQEQSRNGETSRSSLVAKDATQFPWILNMGRPVPVGLEVKWGHLKIRSFYILGGGYSWH